MEEIKENPHEVDIPSLFAIVLARSHSKGWKDPLQTRNNIKHVLASVTELAFLCRRLYPSKGPGVDL
jgi:hypothetical protein